MEVLSNSGHGTILWLIFDKLPTQFMVLLILIGRPWRLPFSWCGSWNGGLKVRKRETEYCDPTQNPHDPKAVLSNFRHVYMADFLAGHHPPLITLLIRENPKGFMLSRFMINLCYFETCHIFFSLLVYLCYSEIYDIILFLSI